MPQARADPLEHVAEVGGRVAAVGGERDIGEPGQPRDPGARLGGLHRELRRRHVGTPRQHRAGHARRHARQRARPVALRQREAGGQLAQQHCQRVLVQRALAVQGQRLRVGGGHLGLHAGQVELGHVAGGIAALGQAQRVGVGAHRLAHDLALGVQRAQLEVGLGHAGLHHQARALQRRLARLRVECRGVLRLGELAEEVWFPRRREARGAEVGGLARRRAEPGLDGGARDAQLAVHLRQQVGLRVAQQRPCGLHAGGGLLQVGVVGRGAQHQVVQHRVGEHRPPRAARLRLGGADVGEARRAVFLEGDGRGGRGHRRERRAGAPGQHEGGQQREQRGLESRGHLGSLSLRTRRPKRRARLVIRRRGAARPAPAARRSRHCRRGRGRGSRRAPPRRAGSRRAASAACCR